ncbi:MAG: hypothetical protein C4542_02875 [Dehalococcoidia bacterium]|nr:MAG: hypothetical protein C4542_02875 [Dehalococcoidia bacterium]
MTIPANRRGLLKGPPFIPTITTALFSNNTRLTVRIIHAVFDYEAAPGVLVRFARNITPEQERQYPNAERDADGLRLIGTWESGIIANANANFYNAAAFNRRTRGCVDHVSN